MNWFRVDLRDLETKLSQVGGEAEQEVWREQRREGRGEVEREESLRDRLEVVAKNNLGNNLGRRWPSEK